MLHLRAALGKCARRGFQQTPLAHHPGSTIDLSSSCDQTFPTTNALHSLIRLPAAHKSTISTRISSTPLNASLWRFYRRRIGIRSRVHIGAWKLTRGSQICASINAEVEFGVQALRQISLCHLISLFVERAMDPVTEYMAMSGMCSYGAIVVIHDMLPTALSNGITYIRTSVIVQQWHKPLNVPHVTVWITYVKKVGAMKFANERARPCVHLGFIPLQCATRLCLPHMVKFMIYRDTRCKEVIRIQCQGTKDDVVVTSRMECISRIEP